MLLPSSGKVNDHFAHIQGNYTDLDGNSKLKDKKKLCNVTNKGN